MKSALGPTNAIQALLNQRALLAKEHACEKEAHRKLAEARGLQRSINSGEAWFPIRTGRTYFNAVNQLVVEVFRVEGGDEEHRFEPGRPVSFFTVDAGGHIRHLNMKASVSYVEGGRMVVAVPDNAATAGLPGGAPAGVQTAFDETSFRLMFEAIDKAASAKDNRTAYLRELFYSRQKAERLPAAGVRLPWLNPMQEHAVNEVLRAKDVAIVHGPPGTGKTTTLVEAIGETLHRESQVLVCAQSNMAVDWISEQLTGRGISVVRIGNPAKVNDKMLSSTYERRFEDHPDYPKLWSIRKTIRELYASRKRGDGHFHQKIRHLKSRAAEFELRIREDIFNEARVIASTLAGSASPLLAGMRFHTLFIDEAAQALEAACWIPILKASRVVLAGDHCQLPPTVMSGEALQGGLGKTLMERIAENKPETVTLLDMQYRMNEQIMRFSSDYFYQGKVKPAPQVGFRGILDLDTPVEWIDTDGFDGQEEPAGDGHSRVNKAEAELTAGVLERYFTKIGHSRILEERIDTGVISPYQAQVHHLRRLLRKNDFFKPYRKLVSINTVDGFQGQERDIILISLVRSNDDGQIGFLRDIRRMNVAITRARMKLIILGSPATLTKHPFYRKLYEYVQGLKKQEPSPQ